MSYFAAKTYLRYISIFNSNFKALDNAIIVPSSNPPPYAWEERRTFVICGNQTQVSVTEHHKPMNQPLHHGFLGTQIRLLSAMLLQMNLALLGRHSRQTLTWALCLTKKFFTTMCHGLLRYRKSDNDCNNSVAIVDQFNIMILNQFKESLKKGRISTN